MTLRLKTVTAGYSEAQIRANFKMIEEYVNEKTLKRSPDRGVANQMMVDLILAPTEVGEEVGYVSTEGVSGAENDVCFIGGVTCTTFADAMLIIDNTGSQNVTEHTTLVRPAINNMLDSFIAQGRDINLGISIIRQTPYLLSPMTTDLDSLKALVTALPTPSGNTNLGTAIQLAHAELDSNKRVGAEGVIIIITDGQPNQGTALSEYAAPIWEAEFYAAAARAAGYRIVVFGVMGIPDV